MLLLISHSVTSLSICVHVGAEGEGPAGKVPYSLLHVHRL